MVIGAAQWAENVSFRFQNLLIGSFSLVQLWVIPSIVRQISVICVINNWMDKINNIVFFLVAHIYYRGKFRVWNGLDVYFELI